MFNFSISYYSYDSYYTVPSYEMFSFLLLRKPYKFSLEYISYSLQLVGIKFPQSRLEEVVQRYLHIFERMLVVAASLIDINDIIEERMSSGTVAATWGCQRFFFFFPTDGTLGKKN
jgi:hypothetical protein